MMLVSGILQKSSEYSIDVHNLNCPFKKIGGGLVLFCFASTLSYNFYAKILYKNKNISLRLSTLYTELYSVSKHCKT